jgi:hypothetical protein
LDPHDPIYSALRLLGRSLGTLPAIIYVSANRQRLVFNKLLELSAAAPAARKLFAIS